MQYRSYCQVILSLINLWYDSINVYSKSHEVSFFYENYEVGEKYEV